MKVKLNEQERLELIRLNINMSVTKHAKPCSDVLHKRKRKNLWQLWIFGRVAVPLARSSDRLLYFTVYAGKKVSIFDIFCTLFSGLEGFPWNVRTLNLSFSFVQRTSRDVGLTQTGEYSALSNLHVPLIYWRLTYRRVHRGGWRVGEEKFWRN